MWKFYCLIFYTLLLQSCGTKKEIVTQKVIVEEHKRTGILFLNNFAGNYHFSDTQGNPCKIIEVDSDAIICNETSYDVIKNKYHHYPILLGTIGHDAKRLEFKIDNLGIAVSKGTFCEHELLNFWEIVSTNWVLEYDIREDTLWVKQQNLDGLSPSLLITKPNVDTFFTFNNNCADYNHDNFIKDLFEIFGKIEVSPNPFSGKTVVELKVVNSAPDMDHFYAKIIDFKGNLVYQTPLEVNAKNPIEITAKENRQLILNVYQDEVLVHSSILTQIP